MRFNLLKVGLILTLLTLLLGCSGVNNSSSSPTTENYRRGTQGIDMSFVNNAPPNRVYEGNNLQVMVDVENKGAYPQEGETFEGYLIFSGPTDAAVDVGSKQKSITSDLPGRRYSFPDGGRTTVTFEDPQVHVPGDAEKYEAPILISSCYKYQTLATPTICIDPNPYSTVKTVKACTVRENVALDGGQGGPVVVSRIEQFITEDTATFRITFRNAGSGTVFHNRAMPACIDSDLEYNDVDRIAVHVSSPSLGNAQCDPDPNHVVLNNGRGYITCKFDIGHIGGAAYTEQLRIVMDYGYSDYISTSVDIINIE